MASVPTEIKGKFFLIATIEASPGKAEEVKQILGEIRTRAISETEKGTLKYHTTRGVGAQSDKFVVVEEYDSSGAFDVHLKGEAFHKLATIPGLFSTLDLQFSEEFSN